MKNKEIIDYNFNYLNSNIDLNYPKSIHHKLSQYNIFRKNILTMNNFPLKQNIFQWNNTLGKDNNQNHLSIKDIKFPNNISNTKGGIKNIYLSNSSKNFFSSSKTEKNILKNFRHPKKRKFITHQNSIHDNNFIIKNNNFNTIDEDNSFVERKKRKFIRKIDLELNDILINNKKNSNNKMKIFKSDINNLKNKTIKFNTTNFTTKSNINDIKPFSGHNNNNAEKVIKIKKNKSEKLFNNFSRKVVYLNQKNNFITEKDIINLIQKEEKKLTSNYSESLLNKNKRKNGEEEKYGILLPLLNDISTNKKNLIKLSKSKVNKNYIGNNSNNNNSLLSEESLNKEKNKENNNINFLKTYYENAFSKKSNLQNITDNNNKDYSSDLKTVYNQCYEKYEFKDNVDYYKEKINKYRQNFINKAIDTYNSKNNNYNNNKKKTNLNINIIDDNKHSSIKVNLSENSIKSNSGEINLQKKYKSEEIKPYIDKKMFKFVKIINKKSSNNDLLNYLSNYNITSQKFFENILKAEEEQSSKRETKEKKKINRTEYKNKMKKGGMKKSHKFWNLKALDKNKVKDVNKNTYWNDSKIKKEVKEDSISKKTIINEDSLKKSNIETEINNDIITSEQTRKKNYYNTINGPSIHSRRQSIYNIVSDGNNMNKNIGTNKTPKINEINENEENNKNKNKISIKRFKSKNFSHVNNFNNKEKENNDSPSKKVNFPKFSPLKRLKSRNYQNLGNNSKTKSKNKSNNNDYLSGNDEDDDDNIEGSGNKNEFPYKKKYTLKQKISFNELSFLDDNKVDNKQKLILIKKYKEKSVDNLYTIVKENLEENKELTLNIETLISFLIIKSYKKYINIMKLLTAKGRMISGLNDAPINADNIKDEEIIKYILRLFSDESSSYYLIDKSKNIDNNIAFDSSSFLKNLNFGRLSHKKYIFMNEFRNSRNHKTKKKKTKKYKTKPNAFLSKFKKPVDENQKVKKNFKQFIYEEMTPDRQKRTYFSQKINLTNELKYQIGITHNLEGKERFQNLLEQIESMKNENIKEYISILNENYNLYKGEIKDLINDREKEERINYFIHDLIDDRNDILKRKEKMSNDFHLEDHKFETLMGKEYMQ